MASWAPSWARDTRTGVKPMPKRNVSVAAVAFAGVAVVVPANRFTTIDRDREPRTRPTNGSAWITDLHHPDASTGSFTNTILSTRPSHSSSMPREIASSPSQRTITHLTGADVCENRK